MSDNQSTDEVKRGGISVQTQHIFPIIKKWLYSDKDIFLREIVSNASDAATKLKRLVSLSETELPDGDGDFRINVVLDRDARTVSVSDNGIGMNRDELERYICSIALSGALEFVEKYESGDRSDGIIGHFGLGFYSSFMVSDTVEIDTLSYDGSPAVHWTCTEAGEYEISPSERTERGTTVTMHIAENESAYLEDSKLREILNRYCSFMPIPVYFDDGKDHSDESAHDHEGNEEHDDGCKCEECSHVDTEIKPINDTVPLWSKKSSDVTPEEYNAFYHKLFIDADDPLFYIHINADYPLNFKGILFFPKIRNETQSLEGQVKLYYNQVFVADNIKEVLPDYLLMLRGALDCPELPLNVSRSYLQDDSYVRKIAAHIVKKVTDKLNSLAANERETYEKVYNDIRIFIEYACLRESKFYDRVKDSLLLRLTDGKFKTHAEYLESAADKHAGTVYYTNDPALQAQYVSMLTAEGADVAVFDLLIDSQYISAVERYRDDMKFVRVDSGLADILKSEIGDTTDLPENLITLFREVSGNEKLTVKTDSLKNAEVPAILSVSEESRRFEDMMKLYAAMGETASAFPLDYTLTLNLSSPLYAKLTRTPDGDDDSEKLRSLASYVYRLAVLAQKKLTADELSAFLADSYRLLGML